MLFSHWVMSSSLWPHGLQHTSLPCPSPSPRVCSNSCPLNWWWHPNISFSVTPFSSCPQSFPTSGPFPMSQLFISGGQNIGASALASVLPMNIQGWFPLGLTGLISLLSKGLSRVFSNMTVRKQLFLQYSAFFMVWLSYPYMTTGKNIAFTIQTFDIIRYLIRFLEGLGYQKDQDMIRNLKLLIPLLRENFQPPFSREKREAKIGFSNWPCLCNEAP